MRPFQKYILRILACEQYEDLFVRSFILGVVATLIFDCLLVFIPLMPLVHIIVVFGIPFSWVFTLHSTHRLLKTLPFNDEETGILFLFSILLHSITFYGCTFLVGDQWSVILTAQIICFSILSGIFLPKRIVPGFAMHLMVVTTLTLLAVPLPIYLGEQLLHTNQALFWITSLASLICVAYWIIARIIPRKYFPLQTILDYEDPHRGASLDETRDICKELLSLRLSVEALRDQKLSLEILAEQFKIASQNVQHPAALVTAEWGEMRQRIMRATPDEESCQMALDRLDTKYSKLFFEKLYSTAHPFTTEV